MTAPRAAADDGQVMILMIFFALIIAAVITAVVDVSTVFLAQRQLQSTADGTALVAGQQVDPGSVYSGTLDDVLPLLPAKVHDAATGYAGDPDHIPHNCRVSTYQLQAAHVDADGRTVTVVLTCRVPLPFVGAITGMWSDGVPITEIANARAAVTPLN